MGRNTPGFFGAGRWRAPHFTFRAAELSAHPWYFAAGADPARCFQDAPKPLGDEGLAGSLLNAAADRAAPGLEASVVHHMEAWFNLVELLWDGIS